jgi:hypothetical protein
MDETLHDTDPFTHPVDRFRALWKVGRPDVVAFVAAGGLAPDDITDVLRFDQQERWRAGEDVPVEWYLEHFPQLAADPDGVKVLIYGEVVARTERGEHPALADFLLRFPEHAEFLQLQWEVHTALENAAVTSTMTFEDRLPPRTSQPPPVVPGYEIEAEVGRGAVGVVYRARQAAINRLCALKVVAGGQQAWTEKLKRFFEEGRSIARLRHPNIVGIYDLGTHETGPFMALEWVGGGTLADRIAKKPFSPIEAAKLTATLARAVGHAHQNGIIHRDLKPANILLTETEEPKIADFGLAKYLHGDSDLSTIRGRPVGTPTYMSPEQTRGLRPLTPAVDVYGLGVILYEMLTRRVPHAGATIGDTLRLVATQKPIPPRELNASVPPDLETIVLKCLSKDPTQRYQNGHELADDLGRFLAGESIAARPIGPVGRAGRHLIKNRRRAAAIVFAGILGVLAVAVSIVGMVWLHNELRWAKLAEQELIKQLNDTYEAKNKLRLWEWRTLVSEAQAIRKSGRPGQRHAALAKLTAARAMLDERVDAPSVAEDLMFLRTEAIACLALPDVDVDVGEFLPPGVFYRDASANGSLPKMLATSPDGRLGLTTDRSHTIRLWDLQAGRPMFSTSGQLGPIPFHADGRTLTVQSDKGPLRFHITLPTCYRMRRGPVPMTFSEQIRSSNNQYAAVSSGYGAIEIRHIATGAAIARLEIPEPTRLQPTAFDTELEAVGIDTRTIHSWDIPALRSELAARRLDWSDPE